MKYRKVVNIMDRQQLARFKKIIQDVQVSDGGATVDKYGKPAQAFYFGSTYPQFEKVVDNSKLVTVELLQDYINHVNKVGNGLFNREDMFLGLWNDPTDNKVYIDVSQGFDNVKDVSKACKDNGQIAYFDAKKGASVRL